MGIDVNAANREAAAISNEVESVRNLKKRLNEYRSGIQTSWAGTEVPLIMQAIDQRDRELDNIISKLQTISNTIRQNAAAIQREEQQAAQAVKKTPSSSSNTVSNAVKQQAEAAAKAAAELKEREIQAAEQRLDKANKVYTEANKKYVDVYSQSLYKNGSKVKKAQTAMENAKAEFDAAIAALKKLKQ